MDIYILFDCKKCEILDSCSSLRMAEELKEEYYENGIIEKDCIVIEKRILLMEV
jgi:hypothetical protein